MKRFLHFHEHPDNLNKINLTSDGNCYVWVVLFFGSKRVNDKSKNMWKMDSYRGGNETNQLKCFSGRFYNKDL